MIHLVDLVIAYASQTVLDHIGWHIGPNDRIGLVGNNGSGKSTLMKAIAGIHEPDEGQVVAAKSITFGYLPQDGVVHEGRSLLDETASVFGRERELQREERRLREELDREDDSTAEYRQKARRFGEIHDELVQLSAYEMESRIEKVLIGLGFRHEDLPRDCSEFSGGWQMRIALAKVLLQEPNMLLLDEPTNYLDLEARVFLEKWLKDYPNAVLLVSHDRHFLDQVVGRISEIHDGKITDYHCNYTRYLVEREERLERLRAQAERVAAERVRIEAFINRFRYKADKAAMVQSRVKMLEKLDKVEIPSVRKKINFRFPQPRRSGKIALEGIGLSARYGDGPEIFSGVDFKLMRGEKVALVGVNGAGKTTLIRLLAGVKDVASGELVRGYNIDMDYFAQEVHKQLDPEASVYETLSRSAPYDLVPRLRNLLGAFLFSGEDIDKKVAVLSGGERNRLALARMLLVPSNLLLMDEPTNHLDLDAKDVLLNALKRFEGTILFVSHDRYFLDNLATKVYAMEDGRLTVYPGTYSEFLDHLENRKTLDIAEHSKLAENVAAALEKDLSKEERVRKWKEDKQRQRERQRLERRVAELEEGIAAKERGAHNLLKQMAEPQYATNFTELEKLSELKEAIEKELAALTAEWEDLSLQLEELQEDSEP